VRCRRLNVLYLEHLQLTFSVNGQQARPHVSVETEARHDVPRYSTGRHPVGIACARIAHNHTHAHKLCGARQGRDAGTSSEQRAHQHYAPLRTIVALPPILAHAPTDAIRVPTRIIRLQNDVSMIHARP
jgi:hypothetical protein